MKKIVGLTGTPSSNGLMDLFAEFKVLDMGKRLGRFYRAVPGMLFPARQDKPDLWFTVTGWFRERRKPFIEKISDITISMKAADYLNMPELVSTEHKVYLDEKEKQQYREMKEQLVMRLPEGEITAANAASLSGKLSQLANGAVYGDDGVVNAFHGKKLDALEDLVESANGRPVLVAYWFKHDLTRMMSGLKS